MEPRTVSFVFVDTVLLTSAMVIVLGLIPDMLRKLPPPDIEQPVQFDSPEKLPSPVKLTVAALTGDVMIAAIRPVAANSIALFICHLHEKWIAA
jgi:hypothetical protein